ncbi:MAG TPA: hypothetical protein VK712_03575 [Verrucomicrobiae bacterium]|nr:hypothetical protein [Verrucomicrobiae bacterium]
MKAPTFISNTTDDKHCVQASVGMVLGYFLPERKFSMAQLEKLTGFVEGKGAWEMEELLNYDRLGLEAVVIVNSSYEEFAKRGFDYLAEVMGSDIAQWAETQTGDIELEKKRAAEVAKKDIHEYRVPTREDIRRLLAEGWLVMLETNARKLNYQAGFTGHRVLVYAADVTGVTMHDPGRPAHQSRFVDWELLEQAWADPNENAKTLIAVRKRN